MHQYTCTKEYYEVCQSGKDNVIAVLIKCAVTRRKAALAAKKLIMFKARTQTHSVKDKWSP